MTAERSRVLARVVAPVLILLSAALDAHSAGYVSASSLLRAPEIRQVAVNPSGTLVAASGHNDGTHGLVIQVIEDGFKETVFRSTSPINFRWADGNTLLVVESRSGRNRVITIELDEDAYDLAPKEQEVNAVGWLVDALPLIDDAVLWAASGQHESRIYRLPMSELIKPSGRRSKQGRPRINRKYELATLHEWVSGWLSDHAGTPRAALIVKDDDPPRYELQYRSDAGSSWGKIGSWDAEASPTLAGIAKNGHDLLVFSNDGRDTVALFEYLVDEKKLGAVLYENPRFDLTHIVRDYQGYEVIAVVYREGGLLRYHHLDLEQSAQQRWIEARFPGENMVLTSRTADRRFATAFVNGPRNPGRYYFIDAKEQRTIDIGAAKPWLRPSELVDVESFEVESSGGLLIEAFLALPKRFEGKRSFISRSLRSATWISGFPRLKLCFCHPVFPLYLTGNIHIGG
jgi:dipeptidyl aminopeptidase/acylaminoacyl peptidase